MNTLSGMAKAQAWMDYVAFLELNNIAHIAIFEEVLPSVKKELSDSENAIVDKWMREKGSAIQAYWS